MICTKMRTCCCCLDLSKGSIVTGVACIVASLVTFVFIILGLVYWKEFSEAVGKYYETVGFTAEAIEQTLSLVWIGNIFTLFVIVIYLVLCVLLIIGVQREQYKHIIPWISVTSFVLPFFTISFIIQLIFGIVASGLPAVLVPAIIVLIWCCFWAYGLFCVLSHYRVLKGDLHLPVTTIYKR